MGQARGSSLGRAASQRQFKARLIGAIIFTLWIGLTSLAGQTPSLIMILFAVGAGVSAAGARLQPGRWLFAWGAAYLAAIGLVVTIEVVLGLRGWPWLLGVAVGLLVVFGWTRQFSFYAPRD